MYTMLNVKYVMRYNLKCTKTIYICIICLKLSPNKFNRTVIIGIFIKTRHLRYKAMEQLF